MSGAAGPPPAAASPPPLRDRQLAGGSWQLVAARSDGTAIHRVEARGGAFYVKTAPPRPRDDARFHAAREAERLAWLSAEGLPAPAVVDAGEDERTMWLVTTAVEGRPAASHWTPRERLLVVDAVADAIRALHAVAPERCPFDHTLAVALRQARDSARAGTLDLDDLDPSHAGWSAEQLLAKLDATPPPPEDDVVVCHGDLCLDNVLVADDATAVTGLIDVGRLGRADRWVDLAIGMRSFGEDLTALGFDARHAERFRRRCGVAEIDPRKLAFYRLLDEFV